MLDYKIQFFEPYLIDIDMITTWYDIADSKPEFRIDRDNRTLVSLKQQVTVGWSDSEDEVTSDFTALPSTTVQMAPLYSQEFLETAYNSGVKENDEAVEENKSQNPKSETVIYLGCIRVSRGYYL